MCSIFEVSRSSYYDWRKGETYVLKEEKASVDQQIKVIFEEHKSRYGSRRIEAELKSNGQKVGRYQIRNRLREAGLKAIQSKSYVPKTTQTNPNLRRSDNLLLEMDSVDKINQVWISDITYLPANEPKWLYLATWMDINSRMIVGWQVSESMEAAIVIDSLKKAILRRKPPKGLIIHSDGGGQYMDAEFRQLLFDNKFEQSMTRVDNHYDNAFGESLFSRFKAELLRGRSFENIDQAQTEIFEYIEIYYNRKRRHSGIQYCSPENYEATLNGENARKTVLKMIQ